MAQKASGSVAEALEVDLPIRGSRCGTFRGHPQGYLQPPRPERCFVCGQGAVLDYNAWPVTGTRDGVAAPLLTDGQSSSHL